MSRGGDLQIAVTAILVFTLALALPASGQNTESADNPAQPASAEATNGGARTQQEVAALRERLDRQQATLAAQQEQISRLLSALEEQRNLVERAVANSQTMGAPNVEQVTSLTPMAPASLASPVVPGGAGAPASAVSQEQIQNYTEKVDHLGHTLDELQRTLAGFRFSGDFRLRADGTYRSGNNVLGPVQNTRGRYRLRLNIDKPLNDKFDFHTTIASGRFDNGLTSDNDFAGVDTRAPIFISEASAGFHPNQNIALRGGKMAEVFADDSRFLFKEELRLNGFQEIIRVPVGSNPLGITAIEFRGGQYILTNPNVPVLPSASACGVKAPATPPVNCAYVVAGYAPGSRVKDANLFHQGIVISQKFKSGWHQTVGLDMQLWRNQNQVAMAASAAGFGAVLNPPTGVTLAGPITGTGTATTTPNGMIFTAQHFQIAHLNYHVGFDGLRLRNREMPLDFDMHLSRNVGSGFLRDALMGIASFGAIRQAGDVRLLYAYAVKEGNSMISEFTDDYVGTLSGVNIRTHEVGVAVGLSRFLAWQNYLYIVNPLHGNDPSRSFFVPYPAGANTNYRVHSQLQFKF